MQSYFRDGEARAMTLGNRGPIRFTDEGRLHPEILAAYNRVGFYVFENVLGAVELAELRAEFHEMVERLPSTPDSPLDGKGRPALGGGRDAPAAMWAKPLGDPFGGTGLANGRHVVKMFEPAPAPELPEQVPFIILGPLQYSEAALRLAGHPQLLKIAETIYGEDFIPFTEAVIIKKPGEGASFSWHQDGTTHWQADDWDLAIHGFNFMAQLYGSTAANGVWYLPGTHATRSGGERPPTSRGAADCQGGRCRDQQPAGGARLVRQYQPRLAGHGECRFPSPPLSARRHRLLCPGQQAGAL